MVRYVLFVSAVFVSGVLTGFLATAYPLAQAVGSVIATDTTTAAALKEIRANDLSCKKLYGALHADRHRVDAVFSAHEEATPLPPVVVYTTSEFIDETAADEWQMAMAADQTTNAAISLAPERR